MSSLTGLAEPSALSWDASSNEEEKGVLVVDLIYVVLTVAVFALLALVLRAVERL